MNQIELFNARQVWYELILSGEAKSLDWVSWCDNTLRSIDFIAPYWLCEIALTNDFEELVQLIAKDMGTEHTEFEDFLLDEEALTFGIIYLRFKDEPYEEIWRQLNDVGDPADFVDSGRWKRYQSNKDNNIAKLNMAELTHTVFNPVYEYTLRSIKSYLGEYIYNQLIN